MVRDGIWTPHVGLLGLLAFIIQLRESVIATTLDCTFLLGTNRFNTLPIPQDMLVLRKTRQDVRFLRMQFVCHPGHAAAKHNWTRARLEYRTQVRCQCYASVEDWSCHKRSSKGDDTAARHARLCTQANPLTASMTSDNLEVKEPDDFRLQTSQQILDKLWTGSSRVCQQDAWDVMELLLLLSVSRPRPNCSHGHSSKRRSQGYSALFGREAD